MMELKLKKRVLNITLYDGSKLTMGYPTKQMHDEYIEKLLKNPKNEDEITKGFYSSLGMSEEIFKSLEQPDLYEIGMILTGQKKI